MIAVDGRVRTAVRIAIARAVRNSSRAGRAVHHDAPLGIRHVYVGCTDNRASPYLA